MSRIGSPGENKSQAIRVNQVSASTITETEAMSETPSDVNESKDPSANRSGESATSEKLTANREFKTDFRGDFKIGDDSDVSKSDEIATSEKLRMASRDFKTGDYIRMPIWTDDRDLGFRVWKVVASHSSFFECEEETYQLESVNLSDNQVIQVPCLILETHPRIELV